MPPRSYFAGRRGDKLKTTSQSSFKSASNASDVRGGGTKRTSFSFLKSSGLPPPTGGSASPVYQNSFLGRSGVSSVEDGGSFFSSAFCETRVPPSVKAELQRLYEFREALEQRLLEADVNVYFAESEFYRTSCELGCSLFSEGFDMLGSAASLMNGCGAAAGGAFSASYPPLDASLSTSSTNALPRSSGGGDGKEGVEGGMERRQSDEGGLASQTCHISLASVGIPAPLPSACREVRERGEEEVDAWEGVKDVNDPSYLYEQSMSAMSSPQDSSGHRMQSKVENNTPNAVTGTRGRRAMHLSNSEMRTNGNASDGNATHTYGSRQTMNPHFLHTSYAYDARLHQFSPTERFFSSSSIGAIGRVEGFLSKIAAAGGSVVDARKALHRAAGGQRKKCWSGGGREEERGGGPCSDAAVRRAMADATSPGATSVHSVSNAYAPSLPFSFSDDTTGWGRWTIAGSGGGGTESWAATGNGNGYTMSASSHTGGNNDVLHSVPPSAIGDGGAVGSGDSMHTIGNGGGLGLQYTQGLPTPFSSGRMLSSPASTTATFSLPTSTATSVAVSPAAAAATSFHSSGTDARSKPSNIDERTGKRRYRRRVPFVPKASSASTFTNNDTEEDHNDEGGSSFRGRRRATREQSGKEAEKEPKIRETRKYTKRARE